MSSSANGSIIPPLAMASAWTFFFYVIGKGGEIHIMPQCKLIEEVSYQQVLHLCRQRHTAVTDTKRIRHTRHGLEKISP